MAALLDDSRITDFCRLHGRWHREGDALVTEIKAATFLDGIAAVSAIAQVAEEIDHHPDIDIRWRTVIIRLTTHSAGGITHLDTDLAERIDAIVDASEGLAT